jgi:hypothetical protein
VGANLQVINGLGATEAVNGTGNLIVGYDETGDTVACSNGNYLNQETCEDAEEVWAANQKDGSHNIVAGEGHSYPAYGGLVAGEDNVINGDLATAAGFSNVAAGLASNVNGGARNTASGEDSSISGDDANNASGSQSTVGGGASLTASGDDEWTAPVGQ